ncbi:unnamed protein product [Euphydryas editha]|uniref:Uncharacterized protein n=1 Tax=Euphydryas editha TaxID=104508 RepID=A0AAU9VEW7_EUPED|nr:unnamed protein product [Euphydryas editha]
MFVLDHRTWHMVGGRVRWGQPVGGADGRIVGAGPSRGLAASGARLAAHPSHFTHTLSQHRASAFNRGRDKTKHVIAITIGVHCARADGRSVILLGSVSPRCPPSAR